MSKRFWISEAIKSGWDIATEHIGFFVASLLASFALAAILQTAASALAADGRPSFLSLLLFIVTLILYIIICLGFLKASLLLLDGKEVGLRTFKISVRQGWNFVVATALYIGLVFFGLVLLIVPGVIFAIAGRFYPFFIIEKDKGPVAALEASFEVTRGSRWRLFFFYLLASLIVMLGAMALVIGLFAAIPTVLLAYAYAYRKLSSAEAALPGI